MPRWILFDPADPGEYQVGDFGRVVAGRPVLVADDVAERMLGPQGHACFRPARPEEIPAEQPARAAKAAPRPVGRGATLLSKAGEKSRRTAAQAAAEKEGDHR